MKCEYIDKCGFFQKYQSTKNAACKGFMNLYCSGPNMEQCKRREYKLVNKKPPSDDLMPSGQLIKL